MTHICVSKLTVIGSDNGLSPGRRQVIIWANTGILLIRTLKANCSEILSEINTFSFTKMHLTMSSTKWRRLCLGLNGLKIGLTNLCRQSDGRFLDLYLFGLRSRKDNIWLSSFGYGNSIEVLVRFFRLFSIAQNRNTKFNDMHQPQKNKQSGYSLWITFPYYEIIQTNVPI